jgi:alkanesulfonate monooxygenase SsuD/methylene tetrahydromethanopterin reductase-like flavin-dependent oxidoreductase (luciferase family)
MGVKYAVGLPTVGEFGEVATLLELAVAAERHGWDGVHLWDHVLYDEPSWPVASPIVAAAAIAAATSRVRIILTVSLPRRQVQDVAQDTAAIDALSGRRLTVLAIIGSMDREYTEFGLDPDLRTRGRILDERLARLTDLWSQWGKPRIPIWCGGRWPRRPGLRRAARFDGALPTFDEQRSGNAPVEQVTGAVSFVRDLAAGDIDVAVEGATSVSTAAGDIAPYAAAGITWWIEALGWWRGGLDTARSRIADGPPARPAS